MNNSILSIITELSHEFGGGEYVKGGGGNTSCKDDSTLWVKPSGTTLASLEEKSFVAMDRKKLSLLYSAETPSDSAAREELVKNIMADAVHTETPGRASVEAPLHDSLSARFVVHTHPALVNGLTCSLGGEEMAKKLFPNALWIPYTDPGYTLCMSVRKAIKSWKEERGVEPEVIFLGNHGVFICADDACRIRKLYSDVMSRVSDFCKLSGITNGITIGADPLSADIEIWKAVLREGLGADAAYVAVSGYFPVAPGPLSPDHIVYAKSYAFDAVLTAESLRAFKTARGYSPRVVVVGDSAVLGLGTTEKTAKLALTLAKDGSDVMHFARAFGGINILSDKSRLFIENWEVEAYRAKQSAGA